MTGYDSGTEGLAARAVDFLRLRGRLEASPFHFINLGVLAYIGMGQVREAKKGAGLQRFVAFSFGRQRYLLVRPRHSVSVGLANRPREPRRRLRRREENICHFARTVQKELLVACILKSHNFFTFVGPDFPFLINPQFWSCIPTVHLMS